MPDNSVSFRLTVTGAAESVQAVERVRTALSGVALSLDRNIASMLSSNAVEQQGAATTDSYQAAIQSWTKSNQMASDSAGQSYAEHLRLAAATNAARDAVQGATAPTGLWAKGISDAAKAAASGVQPHSNLAAAFGRTGAASQQFGSTLRQQHQDLFESARLTRSFIDAILLAAPGAGTLTGIFTRLSRETSGFTVAQVGATAGVLAIAVAIGEAVAIGKQYVDTQNKANAAIRDMDFSAATAGIKASGQEIADFEANLKRLSIDILTGDMPVLERLAGAYSAIAVAMQTPKVLIGELAGEQRVYADAAQKTWETQEKGTSALKVLTAQVEAERAALLNARAAAENLPDLAATYEKEAASIRKLADDQANEAITLALVADRKLREVGTTEAIALADQKLGDVAAEAAAKRAGAYSKADAVILAGKKDVAEKLAQEIQDAGRLIEIRGRVAAEALRASQSEVDARLAVAKADADFFGTSLQGLAQYQAARRASIIAEGAVELAALEAVQAKERQAQVLKVEGTTGPEHAAGLRELERLDADSYLKRQELADSYAQKLRANDLQTTEERRANYARDIGLVAATYDHESALGQEDLSAKLGFLRQAALDENLSLQQRRQYQEQFYSQAKQAEQGAFDVLKAAGQVSTTQEVARLRQLADAYGANSQARIAAEQQWADKALALRAQVASIGQSLIERAVSELEKEGTAQISLSQIEQKVWEMKQKAMQALSSGGSAQEIRDALSLSGAFAELTKTGVSAGTAISGGLDAARKALSGIREEVTDVTTSTESFGSESAAAIGTMGTAAAKAKEDITALTASLLALGSLDFSRITGAVGRASEQTKALGQAAVTAGDQTAQATAAAASGWDATTAAIRTIRDEEGKVTGMTNELTPSFDRVKEAALGVGTGITSVGDSFKMLGGVFNMGFGEAQTGLEALKSTSKEIPTIWGTWPEAAKEAIGQVFSGVQPKFATFLDDVKVEFPDAIGTALDGALSLVDPFVEAVNAKMASGTSTWGDTLVANLMRQLQLALDAAARAS